jgi:hypothetical protein
MGLRIQLGHPPGITCRRPTTAFGDDFVIIDVHGMHPTGLDFCGCEQEVSHLKQLLRARLFPSTVTDPRTAATFAVLEFFHILSFESKVSAYEFYHSLARRTDNTGITPIHVGSFSTSCIQIYLHKRSGSLLSIPKDSPRVEKHQSTQMFRSWPPSCRNRFHSRWRSGCSLACMPTSRKKPS